MAAAADPTPKLKFAMRAYHGVCDRAVLTQRIAAGRVALVVCAHADGTATTVSGPADATADEALDAMRFAARAISELGIRACELATSDRGAADAC